MDKEHITYDPEKHHRHSIRMKGYDYSTEGFYFITIVCNEKNFCFGHISDGETHLNDAGAMVAKWIRKTEQKFIHITCHEMAIMPNHIHCIWQITQQEHTYTINSAVQWLKTMTTNEYIHGVKNNGWPPFNKRLWQRNYYEHIIRNSHEYQLISEYILNNPYRWADDRYLANAKSGITRPRAAIITRTSGEPPL